MKKYLIFAVVLVLLCNLAVTAHAAQNSLVMEDVITQSGDVVYLKLRLSEVIRGDAIGITFTYDKQVLKLVEEECSWARTGVLQDFDHRKNAGVWADGQVTDLSGEVCTLAFQVIADKAYFDTVVSCTLIIKNGAQETAKLSAQAHVGTYCDHQYGEWSDVGDGNHQQTCQRCGRENTGTHNWGQGKTYADSDHPNMEITEFICKQCHVVVKQEHPIGNKPAAPEVDKPTAPNESQPTTPSHTTPTPGGSTPTTKPNGQQPSLDKDNDPGNPFVLPVILVAVAAVMGAAFFMVRKKR